VDQIMSTFYMLHYSLSALTSSSLPLATSVDTVILKY
jgi:hypothetical protein